MWVMVIENFPGRVDTTVDVGVKVSNLEFFPDILDIRYRENNRAAPPVTPYYPPSDGNGPTELDFEIYASNSMENYEPPPPLCIPFGFPFEDYYDEAIGVDYISKEEKPASSLLQFLDSLNAKKAEEGGNSTKSPLFAQSPRTAVETAEEELGFPLSMSQYRGDGGVDRGTDGEARVNASRPMDFNLSSPEAEENSDQSVLSSNRAMEESKPWNAQSNTALDSQHALSSTISMRIENSGKHSFSQARTQPMESTRSFLLQNGSQEELKGSNTPSVSNEVIDEARVEDEPLYSQSSPAKENVGDASPAPSIRPSQITEDAHISKLLQGNSGQERLEKRFDEGVSQSKSGQNARQNVWTAETPELHVNQMHEVASAKVESLTHPATAALVQNSIRDITGKSRYYEPREGDLILGAVMFMNDQKVDLEIGAELSALMPLRDLQPRSQNVEKMFFEIPSSEDSFNVPLGASLLVTDKMDFDGPPGNGAVDIGTVVLAEVTGRTIIDGRAILSCKSPAQRLAWCRLEQLMRLGEAVQLEIVQWNEGGLLGYFEGVRAFLPKSELVQRPESTSVLKSYVGSTLSVAVLQTDRQKSNVIMSEVRAWMSKNLQLGTVHDVTVTRVHSYGMQVEINNTKIRGFVHKTNFSNEYVNSVSNYFAAGDKARVMLIKGRNPGQISFSLADLEKENGLLLQNKEQVFQDAEEMGRRFRERFSEEERQLFGVAANETSLDYQGPEIANLAWLHL